MTGPPTPRVADDQFIRTAVEYAIGAAPVQRIAAVHGITDVEVLAQLSEPQVQREVERLAAEAEQSGMAVRARAREALNVCMERIRTVIETGETAPGILIRAAEFLERVALLAPKEEQATGSSFHIHINLTKPDCGEVSRAVIDVPVEGE